MHLQWLSPEVMTSDPRLCVIKLPHWVAIGKSQEPEVLGDLGELGNVFTGHLPAGI